MNRNRTPLLIVPLALILLAYACGGGGGSSSTTSTTTATSANGFYQLTGGDSAARSDLTPLNLYLMVDPPYLALYGKDDSCASLATINETTVTGDTITMIVTFAAQESGVASCDQYVIDHGARSDASFSDAQTIIIVMTIVNAQLVSMVFDQFGSLANYSLYTSWVAINNQLLSGHTTGMTMAVMRSLLAAYITQLLTTTPTATPTAEPTIEPTTTPVVGIAQSCAGVTHGSSTSVVNVCVKVGGVATGTSVTFSLVGANGNSYGPAAGAGTTNASGVACADFTIASYGDYAWEATVPGDGLSLSSSGTLSVGSANASCSL